jgi:hypothetical protein
MELIEELQTHSRDDGNHPFSLELSPEEIVQVYPKSINHLDGDSFFMGRSGGAKYLFIKFGEGRQSVLSKFQGEEVRAIASLKQCPLNHENAVALQELFDFTRPGLVGLRDSIGFGDRLGIANPGHLRSIIGTQLGVVLAQQSIRELERTNRTPAEVMDAAIWAVFQEGYKQGFGADADHLKTTEHVDRMMRAGFKMFTFDPSAFVVNEAATLPAGEISSRLKSLPWEALADTPDAIRVRYEDKTFRISDDLEIHATADEFRRALVKYGGVIAHAALLNRHLEEKYPGVAVEIELSVDETDSPTTPFEHFLIANELKRLGVRLTSLAPRFVGDFEKGIDFKGDVDFFKREYIKHATLAEALGPYKLSIHSGSDKFTAYDAIGSLPIGHVHVKTAGTSYLEALRTLAEKEPALFGEILNFSRNRFEADRASYHVSAELSRVPTAGECPPERYPDLLEENNARQVLHVTFGSVVTDRQDSGQGTFKFRILSALDQHEERHYEILRRHFRRHIEPFLGR